MPYITIKQPPTYRQISFEDMMAGIQDLSKYVMPNITNTRTYWVDRPNPKLLENTDVAKMIEILAIFNKSKEALFSQDRASLYHTFYIPKSSGGLRRIDAPKPELMNALRELKTLFETHMFALYHTTAFAYVRGRSTIDAIKRHQRNESKWFLKLDFADFFGSTTPAFVLEMLAMIFPFSEIVKFHDGSSDANMDISSARDSGIVSNNSNFNNSSNSCDNDSYNTNNTNNNCRSNSSNFNKNSNSGNGGYTEDSNNCRNDRDSILNGKHQLQKALSLCFLSNGLPQGTPISPFLTNVMMIAIDHNISNSLRKFDNRRFVYTRYADDLLISCKVDFDKDKVQKLIIDTLSELQAPFGIKPEKTRYGSSAGRNWNLGLMLNNDNEITIGHKRKKQFKAMLDNYMRDRASGNGWDRYDIQVLGGLISYYRMVEKDYINYLLQQYGEKHGADIDKCIKVDLAA